MVELPTLNVQRGFEPLHRTFHCPRDSSITEVAFHARPQAANVFGFRKVHLEKKTSPSCKRKRIVRCWRWQMRRAALNAFSRADRKNPSTPASIAGGGMATPRSVP